MIGDPREVGERTLNTASTVADWTDRIRGQLARFVDFDETASGAVVENNLTWTSELGAIEFLRDIGKYFSVNVMLDRDTVRRRLEGEGISAADLEARLRAWVWESLLPVDESRAVDRLHEYVAVGVTHFIVAARPPYDVAGLERFLTRVAARVRA